MGIGIYVNFIIVNDRLYFFEMDMLVSPVSESSLLASG